MLIKLFSFFVFSDFLFANSVDIFQLEILSNCDGAEVFNFFFSLAVTLGFVLMVPVALISLLKSK
jgi:hypothetical protein